MTTNVINKADTPKSLGHKLKDAQRELGMGRIEEPLRLFLEAVAPDLPTTSDAEHFRLLEVFSTIYRGMKQEMLNDQKGKPTQDEVEGTSIDDYTLDDNELWKEIKNPNGYIYRRIYRSAPPDGDGWTGIGVFWHGRSDFDVTIRLCRARALAHERGPEEGMSIEQIEEMLGARCYPSINSRDPRYMKYVFDT